MLTDVPRHLVGGNGPNEPFAGFVSSDFGAISNMNGVHKITASAKESIAKSVSLLLLNKPQQYSAISVVH
jgi:beta-glucosidase-like glycosyl hydrolase